MVRLSARWRKAADKLCAARHAPSKDGKWPAGSNKASLSDFHLKSYLLKGRRHMLNMITADSRFPWLALPSFMALRWQWLSSFQVRCDSQGVNLG